MGLIHFPTPAYPADGLLADDEPRPAETTRPRRIIVGVTHDSAARNALRWAARAALAHNASLLAVTAYDVPHPVPTMYGWTCVNERDAEIAAHFMQRNVLHEELRGEHCSTRVRSVVARGDPASVLVATASRADLLVVGRRTARGRRLIARSVSERCATHADCAVVIVRGDLDERQLSDWMLGRLIAPTDEGRDVIDLHMHRERRRAIEVRRRTL